MRAKRVATCILVVVSMLSQSTIAEARIGHHHAHRTAVCRPPSPGVGQESMEYTRGCVLRNSGVVLTIFGAITGGVGTAMLLGSRSAPRSLALVSFGFAAPTLFSGIALWGAGQIRMDDARGTVPASAMDSAGTGLRFDF